MTQLAVKDANGDTQSIEAPLAPGRAGASASRPVVLSTEDLAALNALATLIGEVQANPTANTLLDRLKVIETALAGSLAVTTDVDVSGLALESGGNLEAIAGKDFATEATLGDVKTAVEALSALIAGGKLAVADAAAAAALAALHTDLATTLAGYVDGLEGLIGTSNSTLADILTGVSTTLAGYVDGLETLVTSSNTTLDTIHTDLATTLSGLLTDLKGYTDQLEGYVDGLETLAAAATPAGTNIIGKVGIDQSTPGTTNAVALIPGQSGIAAGAGAVGATVPRVTLANDDPLVARIGEVQASPTANTVLDRLKALATLIGEVQASPTANTVLDRLKALATALGEVQGSPTANTILDRLKTIGTNVQSLVDFGAGEYETVAASQTDQVIGATGGAGDYLAGVLIVPSTTSPGAVSIKDGSGSSITIFAGGAASVSNLVPFFVPLGIKAATNWKLTTGTNVSAIAIGNFT